MHIKRGLLVMLLSSTIFAVMSAMIRKLNIDSPHLSCYVIAMVRFLVGNLLVLAAFATGIRKMRWANWRWIVARGTTGGIAVILCFWAIGALGLAKGALYSYTYPIFAALLAVPLLRERLLIGHWISIAIAIVGMAVVTGVAGFSLSAKDFGGLSVGLLSGIAVVCVTKCRETDTSTNIFWSQCLFGMAMALWPALRTWVWPTWGETAMLLLIALLSVMGQLTMTNAYKYTGATYGSLVGLLTPVLSTVFAVSLFHEAPSRSFWIGAVLILVPCAHLSIKPIRRNAPVDPET